MSDKLRWLQNSVDPAYILEEYWAATSSARISKLQDSSEPGKRVGEYLKEYPGLQKVKGHCLVCCFFTEL